MLKKPYKFLENIDNNNYYAIKVADTYYLATETIVKGRGKKELIQGLKVLPIKTFFWYLFLDALTLKKTGDDEKDWGIEKEPIFETLDIKKTRERLREQQKELNKAMEDKNFVVPFDYAKAPHSEAIKAFMGESDSELLCLEIRGAYLRAYHYAKSLKNGNLLIHSCLAQGKPENEKPLCIETYVFSRTTLMKFFDFVKNVEKLEGEKK